MLICNFFIIFARKFSAMIEQENENNTKQWALLSLNQPVFSPYSPVFLSYCITSPISENIGEDDIPIVYPENLLELLHKAQHYNEIE